MCGAACLALLDLVCDPASPASQLPLVRSHDMLHMHLRLICIVHPLAQLISMLDLPATNKLDEGPAVSFWDSSPHKSMQSGPGPGAAPERMPLYLQQLHHKLVVIAGMHICCHAFSKTNIAFSKSTDQQFCQAWTTPLSQVSKMWQAWGKNILCDVIPEVLAAPAYPATLPCPAGPPCLTAPPHPTPRAGFWASVPGHSI